MLIYYNKTENGVFRTGQSLITQNSRYTVTVDVCLLTLVHFHDTILNFL